MDRAAAETIVRSLPDEAIVLDVGGGASPFARADYVIDALPFEEQARLGSMNLGMEPRFCRERWVQLDLCGREPWPFAEKFFDFATCSHVLEDVRDPIWICSELSRVSKAGYIEVPSRVVEQSLGVEHPRYAGYHHHRWLVSENCGELEFRHKPHMVHVTRGAIVATVGVLTEINPKHAITAFWWNDCIRCREVLEFSEDRIIDELCRFAGHARKTPALTVRNGDSLKRKGRRFIYYLRLKLNLL